MRDLTTELEQGLRAVVLNSAQQAVAESLPGESPPWRLLSEGLLQGQARTSCRVPITWHRGSLVLNSSRGYSSRRNEAGGAPPASNGAGTGATLRRDGPRRSAIATGRDLPRWLLRRSQQSSTRCGCHLSQLFSEAYRSARALACPNGQPLAWSRPSPGRSVFVLLRTNHRRTEEDTVSKGMFIASIVPPSCHRHPTVPALFASPPNLHTPTADWCVLSGAREIARLDKCAPS